MKHANHIRIVTFSLVVALTAGAACSRRAAPNGGNVATGGAAPSPSEQASPQPSADMAAGQSPQPDTSTPISQGPVSSGQGTPEVPSAGGSGIPTAPPSTGRAEPPAPEAPPPPPPRVFTLPAGAQLTVYTTRDVSTRTARAGDPFVTTLGKSLVDHDWVVAKQGAEVDGVVVKSDPGGRVKGVASVTVALKRLTLADGRKVDLPTSSFTRVARKTHDKDAEKIIGGAGFGALLGAIAGGRKGAAIGAGVGGGAGTGYVLGTRGDPATIPGESRLMFRLTSPIRITELRR